MLDAKGTHRFGVITTDDSTSMGIHGVKGEPRIIIQEKNNCPQMFMYDENGVPTWGAK